MLVYLNRFSKSRIPCSMFRLLPEFCSECFCVNHFLFYSPSGGIVICVCVCVLVMEGGGGGVVVVEGFLLFSCSGIISLVCISEGLKK